VFSRHSAFRRASSTETRLSPACCPPLECRSHCQCSIETGVQLPWQKPSASEREPSSSWRVWRRKRQSVALSERANLHSTKSREIECLSRAQHESRRCPSPPIVRAPRDFQLFSRRNATPARFFHYTSTSSPRPGSPSQH